MVEHQYPAGSIILFESGEYSDFGYVGQLVALKDLDLPKRVEEYKAQYVKEDEYDTPSPDLFVAWLCATQQCAQLKCHSVHIGYFGELGL